eukprot:g477.t1
MEPLQLCHSQKIKSGDPVQIVGYCNGDTFRASEEVILSTTEAPIGGFRSSFPQGTKMGGSGVFLNDELIGITWFPKGHKHADKFLLTSSILEHSTSMACVGALVKGMIARTDSSDINQIGCTVLGQFSLQPSYTTQLCDKGAIKALVSALHNHSLTHKEIAFSSTAALSSFCRTTMRSYLKLVFAELDYDILFRVMDRGGYSETLITQCLMILGDLCNTLGTKSIIKVSEVEDGMEIVFRCLKSFMKSKSIWTHGTRLIALCATNDLVLETLKKVNNVGIFLRGLQQHVTQEGIQLFGCGALAIILQSKRASAGVSAIDIEEVY